MKHFPPSPNSLLVSVHTRPRAMVDVRFHIPNPKCTQWQRIGSLSLSTHKWHVWFRALLRLGAAGVGVTLHVDESAAQEALDQLHDAPRNREHTLKDRT